MINEEVKFNNFREHLRSIKSNVESASQELSDLYTKIDVKKNQLSDAQKELDRVENTRGLSIKQLTLSINKAKQENLMLLKEKENLEQERSSLLSEKVKLDSSIRNLSKEIDNLKVIVFSLEGKKDSLIREVECLTISCLFKEKEVSKLDKNIKDLQKEMGSLAMGLTVAFSLGLGILLFFVLPLYLTKLLKTVIPTVGSSEFTFNLVDGAIRMTIFVVYIMGISMMKDIKRVFQYHGAEHKSIYAFEAGEELTVENARKHSSLHPRCGTSFLLTVMLVSILVFSFLSHEMPFWKTALSRLVFIPLIAGLSYEFIRYSGKKIGSKGMGLLMAPGLWLQKLTTREPSDDQLEVALISLKEALKNEKGPEVI